VKLRLIVLSLALMSLIAVITGSLLYYSIIKKTVLAEANRRAASDAEAISNMFTAYLSENAKSVKTLAGMTAIKAVFNDTNAHTLAGTNGHRGQKQRQWYGERRPEKDIHWGIPCCSVSVGILSKFI